MADAGNTIELLLWSRGRDLAEVRRRIRGLLDQGENAGNVSGFPYNLSREDGVRYSAGGEAR